MNFRNKSAFAKRNKPLQKGAVSSKNLKRILSAGDEG